MNGVYLKNDNIVGFCRVGGMVYIVRMVVKTGIVNIILGMSVNKVLENGINCRCQEWKRFKSRCINNTIENSIVEWMDRKGEWGNW